MRFFRPRVTLTHTGIRLGGNWRDELVYAIAIEAGAAGIAGAIGAALPDKAVWVLLAFAYVTASAAWSMIVAALPALVLRGRFVRIKLPDLAAAIARRCFLNIDLAEVSTIRREGNAIWFDDIRFVVDAGVDEIHAALVAAHDRWGPHARSSAC